LTKPALFTIELVSRRSDEDSCSLEKEEKGPGPDDTTRVRSVAKRIQH
jgi:hypothetical protein